MQLQASHFRYAQGKGFILTCSTALQGSSWVTKQWSGVLESGATLTDKKTNKNVKRINLYFP